jgi:hypothetical protein
MSISLTSKATFPPWAAETFAKATASDAFLWRPL